MVVEELLVDSNGGGRNSNIEQIKKQILKTEKCHQRWPGQSLEGTSVPP